MTKTVVNRIIAVAACKPHPENYNAHDDSQIEDLRESLRQFGQVRSIVVQASRRNGHYLTVAGHGLLEAARLEDTAKLRADVIPASWSKTKVLAYLAADNELARRGNPDEAQLAAIVAKVHAAEGEALARLAAGEREALSRLVFGEGQFGDDFGGAFESLPDGDRAPFQQMTFTLHDSQVEQVKRAIGAGLKIGDFEDSPNQNSNGNALAFICETFVTEHENSNGKRHRSQANRRKNG